MMMFNFTQFTNMASVRRLRRATKRVTATSPVEAKACFCLGLFVLWTIYLEMPASSNSPLLGCAALNLSSRAQDAAKSKQSAASPMLTRRSAIGWVIATTATIATSTSDNPNTMAIAASGQVGKI